MSAANLTDSELSELGAPARARGSGARVRALDAEQDAAPPFRCGARAETFFLKTLSSLAKSAQGAAATADVRPLLRALLGRLRPGPATADRARGGSLAAAAAAAAAGWPRRRRHAGRPGQRGPAVRRVGADPEGRSSARRDLTTIRGADPSRDGPLAPVGRGARSGEWRPRRGVRVREASGNRQANSRGHRGAVTDRDGRWGREGRWEGRLGPRGSRGGPAGVPPGGCAGIPRGQVWRGGGMARPARGLGAGTRPWADNAHSAPGRVSYGTVGGSRAGSRCGFPARGPAPGPTRRRALAAKAHTRAAEAAAAARTAAPSLPAGSLLSAGRRCASRKAEWP